MPELRYAHVGSTTYNLRDDRLDTVEDSGAEFISRVSTHDGAATIEAIRGNYAIDAGTLLPVNVEGVRTVGFNRFDSSTAVTYYGYVRNYGGGVYDWKQDNGSRAVAIPCSPNTTYCAYTNGVSTSILRMGSTASDLPATPQSGGWTIPLESAFTNSTTGVNTYTTGASAKYLIVQIGASAFDAVFPNLCISLSGSLNGTYKPYWTQTRAIDAAYMPLRKAGSVYDELTATKLTRRVGSRAYAAGDESDPTVITDGTTTYYGLATPTETTISPALSLSLRVENGGTETWEPPSGDMTAPVDTDIAYGWLPVLAAYVQS